MFFFLFFFNDTATTEIYTLSLHDALPILQGGQGRTDPRGRDYRGRVYIFFHRGRDCLCSPRDQYDPVVSISRDRKSTRLNSSHVRISYAVFCLKKKNPPHTPSFPLHTRQT